MYGQEGREQSRVVRDQDEEYVLKGKTERLL